MNNRAQTNRRGKCSRRERRQVIVEPKFITDKKGKKINNPRYPGKVVLYHLPEVKPLLTKPPDLV